MSKPDPQETGIHSVEHLLAHADLQPFALWPALPQPV